MRLTLRSWERVALLTVVAVMTAGPALSQGDVDEPPVDEIFDQFANPAMVPELIIETLRKSATERKGSVTYVGDRFKWLMELTIKTHELGEQDRLDSHVRAVLPNGDTVVSGDIGIQRPHTCLLDRGKVTRSVLVYHDLYEIRLLMQCHPAEVERPQYSDQERSDMMVLWATTVYARFRDLLGYEDEVEWGDGVEVKVYLEDGDRYFTPADTATLKIHVTNVSEDHTYESLVVNYQIIGELGRTPDPALSFQGEATQTEGARPLGGPLEPSVTRILDVPVRAAAPMSNTRASSAKEQWELAAQTWILQELVRNIGNDDEKSQAENKIELEDVLTIKVGDATKEPTEVLYDRQRPIQWPDGEVVALGYPDYRETTGMPTQPGGKGATTDLEEAALYYRHGDFGDCSPGNTYVRALAIRAARFGGTWLDSPAYDDGTDMPESIYGVVENVADFVYEALMDKGAPDPFIDDDANAEGLWKGKWGFGTPPDTKEKFICQEHALLFGALLRALGIPVREVNVMYQMSDLRLYPGRYFEKIARAVFNKKGPWNSYVWQDASSEVWYDEKWNYWGLFDEDEHGKPWRDHLHYNKWFQAYEVFVGYARFKSSDAIPSRFNIGSRVRILSTAQWSLSGVWDYHGFGALGEFHRRDTPPVEAWFFPYGAAVLTALSPVAVEVELPDGRSIGMSEAPTGDVNEWFFKSDRPGLVNDIPGAYYCPQGLELYPDATDPESRVTMPQTIVIPADQAGPENFNVKLTGTGEGDYTLLLAHVNDDGVQAYEEVKGAVQPGQSIEHARQEFTPSGERQPISEAPAEVAAQPAADDVAMPGQRPAETVTALPDVNGTWNRHVDADHGILMEYPPGWELLPGDEDYVLQLQSPADAAGDRHEMVLRADPLAAGTDLDAYAEARERELDSGVGDLDFTREETFTGATDALSFAAVRIQAPEHAAGGYMLMFLTVHNDTGYMIGCRGASEYEAIRAVLRRIAGSLRIE